MQKRQKIEFGVSIKGGGELTFESSCTLVFFYVICTPPQRSILFVCAAVFKNCVCCK